MKSQAILCLSMLVYFTSATPTPQLGERSTNTRSKTAKPVVLPEAPTVSTFKMVGEPIVTYNASSGYVDGKSYTYRYETGTGKIDEFTLFIVVDPVSPDDPETKIVYEDVQFGTIAGRSETGTSLSVKALQERQWWDMVCHYTYDCAESAIYYVAFGGYAIHQARLRFQEFLRRDNYAVLRWSQDAIQQFAIGVASDQFSGFITNKVQQQRSSSPNSCNNDEFERKVQQLTDDLNWFMEELNRRRMNGAKCDHSSETRSGQKGENLAHSMRLSRSNNNYKNVGGC